MDPLAELTEHLSELLDRKDIERNDFISLAVIGEAHRQSLALCGQTQRGPAEVHERWSVRLKEIAADAARTWKVTPGELGEDLNTVWLELNTAAAGRDVEACADAFDGVEQVMAVATVCARMGWLQVEEFQALATRAEQEARQLAPILPELWEYAHRCYTRALPDAEYPQAHAWLEPFARLSPVRTALVSASRLYSPKKRAQMVERVVNRILAARRPDPAPSPEGTPDWGSAWAALKQVLAPASFRGPARRRGFVTAFVRSYCGQLLGTLDLRALRELVKNLAVVEVPGAGVPVTSTSPQVLNRELTLGGGIDVDIHIEWTPAGLSVTYRVDPPQPGALIVLLEDPETSTPLASVAVPADVDGSKKCSVATNELGFDPTARPWHLRVMLA